MITEADYVFKFLGSKELAQKLGAFYTPPQLGQRMVAKFDRPLTGKTCLDPTVGYGNLLIQMLNAKVQEGEDPSQALTEVYGNEFDPDNLKICLYNLKIWARLNGAKWINKAMNAHFHQGDALTDQAYDFPDVKFDLVNDPDENDIDLLVEEMRARIAAVSNDVVVKKPAKKPAKKPVKKPVTKKPETKTLPAQVEHKSVVEKPAVLNEKPKNVVMFSFDSSRNFVLKTWKDEKIRKNQTRKDVQAFAKILDTLSEKGIKIECSSADSAEWKTLLMLSDVSCSAIV